MSELLFKAKFVFFLMTRKSILNFSYQKFNKNIFLDG